MKQDYPNLELIIEDDGNDPIIDLIPEAPKIRYYYTKHRFSVGYKRNMACEHANGEIIIHWDDDDWYAPDWVTRQVDELTNSEADLCGINQINFYAPLDKKSWCYTDDGGTHPWVYGATLAYWKSFWRKHQFKDMQAGEDLDFIWNNTCKIHAYRYTDGYIGIMHADNIGLELFEDPKEKIQIIKWMINLKEPQKAKQKNKLSSDVQLPMVSCIMPTANRQKFISSAIKYFMEQDYPNRELVIVDDGKIPAKSLIPDFYNIRYFYANKVEDIGTKRNAACKEAFGSIIVHWDDDDWYAPDWISNQVHALINSDADICGLNQVQFYSVKDNKYWMTKNMNSKKPWLFGATLAYYKSFWETHPFKALHIEEDNDFVRNNNAKLFAHDYYQGFIAIIHKKNTSIKVFE